MLVEGDLLCHDTHGLQLLWPYQNEIEQNKMSRNGIPKFVAERSSIATWDGQRLPGPCLVQCAIARARPRADLLLFVQPDLRLCDQIAVVTAKRKPIA